MPVLFSICACEGAQYHRLQRRWWMRLFSARRLYRCSVCGSEVLAPKDEVSALSPLRGLEPVRPPPSVVRQ